MTWRDKLELGLKKDAAFRKDNLTPEEVRGPEIDLGPGRSPAIPLASGDKTEFVEEPDQQPPKARSADPAAPPCDDDDLPATPALPEGAD